MIATRKIFILTALGLIVASSARAQGEAPGSIKATTKVRPDGTLATTVLNADTRTAEETFTNAAGKLLKKTVFSLNERNFSVSAVHYDAQGKVRYKETYKHDGSDRIIESSLFSAEDSPLGRRVFTYDSRGGARIDDYDAAGNLITRPQPVSRTRPDKPVVRRALPVRK